MSKVMTIAWRDFKQTVFRKAFLIAVVVIPVFMIVLFGVWVLLLMTHREPPLVGALAIVDPSGGVAPAA